MQDALIKKLLAEAKTIAILGAKDTPGQAVDTVGRYLIEAGYEVIPINPSKDTVWGKKSYSSLKDVPVPIDVIDVFRASDFCEAHAQEAAALPHPPGLFWMQLGIINPMAMRIAKESGFQAVEDACLMVQHKRLFQNHT